MQEQSGFITIHSETTPERHVYATAFLPDTLPASRAVVIVEPLAEEKRAAYRMLVRLARALAADGIAAIRFDLSGTGDSTLPHSKATFEAWIEDTLAAAEEIRTLAASNSLSFVGARAGALVAAAAAGRTTVKSLVFAEPILSGTDFLNDLERRQSIKNMMSGTKDAKSARESWDSGAAVDFGGYLFSSTLADGLAQADLKNLLQPLPADTAVNAIRVSASKKLPPAWDIFGEHTAIIADKPFWGQLDYYESDFVNDAIRARL